MRDLGAIRPLNQSDGVLLLRLLLGYRPLLGNGLGARKPVHGCQQGKVLLRVKQHGVCVCVCLVWFGMCGLAPFMHIFW